MAELSGELGYPVDESEFGARVGHLAAREDQLVLVAEYDGLVVGWVHAHVTERLTRERFCELAGVVVAEAHRGRGIGAALVGAVEAWAAERGLVVRVRSNVTRERTHRFYLGRGYAEEKMVKAFERS